MKRIKLLVIVALALTICLPGMAAATMVSGGEVLIPGDWSFTLHEYNFTWDHTEIFYTSGGIQVFGNGMSNFSVSGWSSQAVNPNYALATGPTTTDMNVTYSGTDVPPPFDFDIFSWNGPPLTGTPDYVHVVFTGTAWNLSAGVHDPSGVDYNRVPLPPSALLLGSGLLGLGLLGWRRARKES